MTESEAIEIVQKEKAYMDSHAGRVQSEAFQMAINALEERIAKKHDKYVPELDNEIKLPKISRLEAKAIKVALYHQWFRITDLNGKATSCSQEMADATYRMLYLFENLIKESDKGNEIKEN